MVRLAGELRHRLRDRQPSQLQFRSVAVIRCQRDRWQLARSAGDCRPRQRHRRAQPVLLGTRELCGRNGSRGTKGTARRGFGRNTAERCLGRRSPSPRPELAEGQCRKRSHCVVLQCGGLVRTGRSVLAQGQQRVQQVRPAIRSYRTRRYVEQSTSDPRTARPEPGLGLPHHGDLLRPVRELHRCGVLSVAAGRES
jgi:hypothetical protein